jgi:hypothetical protein
MEKNTYICNLTLQLNEGNTFPKHISGIYLLSIRRSLGAWNV